MRHTMSQGKVPMAHTVGQYIPEDVSRYNTARSLILRGSDDGECVTEPNMPSTMAAAMSNVAADCEVT